MASGFMPSKGFVMENELPESEETGWRVYGPYTRKDGRKHVCLTKSNPDGSIGIRRTKSYPKFLVEKNLGRRLTADETIDHQDRDHTNDSIDNLILRKRGDHAALDATYVRVEDVKCSWCGMQFTPTAAQRNTRKTIAGPFCSRKCKGRYGQRVQATGITLERQEVIKSYYRLDKDEHAILVEDKKKGRNYIFGTIKDALNYTKETTDTMNSSNNFVYTVLQQIS
jgi:hypothetical protein